MSNKITMEPVEVEARFDGQGKITPLRFTRQGRTYQIDSIGRRWEEAHEIHILAMILSGRVFELVFNAGQGRWYLKPIGEDKSLA